MTSFPTWTPTGTDANSNGLDDRYEAAPGTPGFNADGIGLREIDTDRDGIVDSLDTDSDNDGVTDTDEAGHSISQATIDASADTDGDGLKDVLEGSDINDGFDVNDENLDVTTTTYSLSRPPLLEEDGSNAIPLDTDPETSSLDLSFRDVNDAPVAVDNTEVVTQGAALEGNVLIDDDNDDMTLPEDSVDEDPEGHSLALVRFDIDGNTITLTDPDTHPDPPLSGSYTLTDVGTLTMFTDGSYRFDPVEDFSGDVPTITYTISDSLGAISTAELNIRVRQTPVWSVSGPTSVDEGGSVSWTLALDADPEADEIITVDLTLSDDTTNSSDYGDFDQAVQDAVDAYAGAGTLTFDDSTGTLTFTAENDGDSMAALTIELAITNDSFVEGETAFGCHSDG